MAMKKAATNINVMSRSILLGAAICILGWASVSTAALLGIGSQMTNFPKISFASGATNYDAGTQLLSITASPASIRFAATQPPRPVNPASSLTIVVKVDQNGNLVGAGSSTDLVIVGQIDQDGNGTVDYSGELLTGQVLQFGAQDSGGPTDNLDFRFKVTGGLLTSFFIGKDAGVTVTMESSTFTGSFTVNFTGAPTKTKGNVGPIALCPGSIGDVVWHDGNRNGIQDAGETGMNGVTVSLKDTWNNVLATQVTSSGGNPQQLGYYQFNGLCAGAYTVAVDATTLPSDYIPTTSNVGTNRTIDSNGSPSQVSLPANNSSDQTIDFGYQSPCTGTIGDFVWTDINRNGIQDAGEPGIDGINVTLTNNGAGTTITTTGGGPGAAHGYYQFTGLCAGNYTVTVNTTTLPQGDTPTSSFVGPDSTIDSNGSPATVTLATDDSSNQSIDFGYLPPCTSGIGDFVWHDLNRNGIQDSGEPGIDGVTVQLRNADGALLFGSTTTNTDPTGFAHGYYQFTGLCGGAYTVVIQTPPTGLTPTATNAPESNATNDSNSSPAPVTLSSDYNSFDQTIDFGYVTPCVADIGNFVWFDQNYNGIQDDTGAVALSGVIVNLKKKSDNTLLKTTTTDLFGNYQFTGLCMGNYTVEAVTPAGYESTLSLKGSDRALDSNGSPTTVALVADNSSDQTIDFGFLVTTGPPLGAGDTATIGFWHNKNGQALINSLNGGSNAKNLATWLAADFPYLYGASAGANNMTGKTNADVAALFMKFFSVKGQKTDAQILGAALACYVTNSGLAGNLARPYGFNVSLTGTDAKTYNVGSNGSTIGLTNNKSYTIFDLLQQANLRKQLGIFDANAFNSIFDGINQLGDIK